MFAVIKTGGKQYRVSAGDLLVVEKLDGNPGDVLRFAEVMMLGAGDNVTLGAPVIEGAAVTATLIETRKGEKVRIFKKKRRQGYRRTKGHRQTESVLRVTGLEGAGQSDNWDGEVDLTPRSELQLRARNLGRRGDAAATLGEARVETVVTDRDGGPVIEATVVETNVPETAEPIATEAPPKKARAKKAAPASDDGALIEAPISETPAEAPQTIENEDAQAGVGAQEGTEAAPAKKTRAKKAPTPSEGGDNQG